MRHNIAFPVCKPLIYENKSIFRTFAIVSVKNIYHNVSESKILILLQVLNYL